MDYQSVLIRHKFKFKKSLGQNFIYDDDLLDEIAEAGGADGATVVEIGAGAGTLSRAIAKRANKLNAFEIDEELFPILEETLEGFSNVQIFSNNVLELGVETVDMLIGEPYIVIANLPYYITTPLIDFFLKSENCSSITCLVQKEVAQRICACGGGDFGALSATVQALAVPETVRVIKSWEFDPQPEVDSALLRLKKIEGASYSAELEAFIHKCFTQKRKTLVNNLTAAGMDKKAVTSALEKLGYAPTARAEELGANGLMRLREILE